ncbi:hypothetical protein ACFLXF_04415 [Chloroflexota bacterium]
MEYPINQSAWRRGWNDTKTIWTSWQFYVLDAVVAVVIGGIFQWYWALVVVAFGMLCVSLWATASAPYKQRNEARQRIKELEAQLEKPKLFDILCPTTSCGLPINRLDDGNYQASSASIGIKPISIAHRGDLTTVTHFIMSPVIIFIRADGWETTDAIQVTPGGNPLASPLTQTFTWDTHNPQQWLLNGLPLAMAKDEMLTLPMMTISVANGNEAGAHFGKGETCMLLIRFCIRTDKGAPLLPDYQISLTISDIKNSLSALGIDKKPEGDST